MLYEVTLDELKDVCDGAMEIILVPQSGITTLVHPPQYHSFLTVQHKKLFRSILESNSYQSAPEPKGYALMESASFKDGKEGLNYSNKRETEDRLELQGPKGSPNAIHPKLLAKGLCEHTTRVIKGAILWLYSMIIITHWETGSSKGFSFVDFNSEEVVKATNESMENDEIHGKKVTWVGSNLRVKVALEVAVEPEIPLEAEAVAKGSGAISQETKKEVATTSHRRENQV
ncbi:LOW QUALITY PROTEIN: nucleolin [Galemys pyrenaicus]|uniref:Nucleolin n=1 Tax=Galemys pyrenaicus TaxID=202257 RepID=A0A8J6AHY8_GALPY|nr:LOW QUALITY PROTEIN: nucleolin [Galemys pyrenaicus]